MSDKAYQQGYDTGLADGRTKRARKLKPSLLKSVLTPRYLERYRIGYKDGHYAGLREARYEELKLVKKRSSRQKEKGVERSQGS